MYSKIDIGERISGKQDGTSIISSCTCICSVRRCIWPKSLVPKDVVYYGPYALKINLVFLILHYFHVLRSNNKLKVFQPSSTYEPGGVGEIKKKRYLLNRTTTIDPLHYCFRGKQWIQICACGWRDNFVIMTVILKYS